MAALFREVMLATLVVLAAVGGGCNWGPLKHDRGTGGSGTGAGGASATPPTTVCGPTPAGSACASTCAQAQAILNKDCVNCHEAPPGGHAVGDPLNDILNLDALERGSSSTPYRGWYYVVPGDPEHSLVYERLLTSNHPDCPVADCGSSPPSASELSVLHEWIAGCLPGGGGAGGAGGAGGIGGVGGAGGSVAEGSLASCPPSTEAGSACSTAQLICPTPSGTCICDGTAWVCQVCPAAQPPLGTSCTDPSTGSSVVMNCQYQSVTCSCGTGYTGTWGCGVCPANQPTSGQACGNAAFSCAFGSTNCSCVNNAWDCTTPTCPSPPPSGPIVCKGIFSCQYPREGQVCSCPYWSCSCPISAPADGASCGGDSVCAYGDRTCSCSSTKWHCQIACPSMPPTAGAACSSELSCAYQSALCHCAAGIWICS